MYSELASQHINMDTGQAPRLTQKLSFVQYEPLVMKADYLSCTMMEVKLPVNQEVIFTFFSYILLWFLQIKFH